MSSKHLLFYLFYFYHFFVAFSLNLTIGSIHIWFNFDYGIQTSLSFGIDSLKEYISVDFLGIIVLFVHFSSRKYFKKKTVIDEIDDISGEDSSLQ